MRNRRCVAMAGAALLSLARLEGQQPVKRDSAGIRIVESRSPSLTGARTAHGPGADAGDRNGRGHAA